jgi:hypothetical protein
MIRVLESLRVSSERKLEIVREIKEGSQPSRSFYILLLAASLIASFGLMANSTAVVIGAMLVSPLMTPIIGMSLALVRGNGKLFWRATQAEIFGVMLAIGIAALFGLLPMNLEPTPEMLARTQPNLWPALPGPTPWLMSVSVQRCRVWLSPQPLYRRWQTPASASDLGLTSVPGDLSSYSSPTLFPFSWLPQLFFLPPGWLANFYRNHPGISSGVSLGRLWHFSC